MSHTATIELKILDREALARTADALALPLSDGEVRFYDGTTVRGTLVPLPGWTYPAVVDPQGRLHYDHYEGRWGDPAQLTRFRQSYATQVALAWAQRKGYRLEERVETPHGVVELRFRG